MSNRRTRNDEHFGGSRQATRDNHALIDAVDALVDAALVRHFDPTADEWYTECKICGEWEGHRDTCFALAAQTWLYTPEFP
jgi:hypothetical protein